MTTEEIIALFEKHDDLYLEGFGEAGKALGPTKRADLNALLLLDRLSPGEGDMVSAAEHDVFFPDVLLEDLALVATEEDVKNLLRCGVSIDEDDTLKLHA